jgi:hypothetical protein
MNVSPRHTVATGVTFQIINKDVVSPFEEHNTRLEAGYTLREWHDLEPRERAAEVAMHRLRVKIQQVQNMEVQDHIKRKTKRR